MNLILHGIWFDAAHGPVMVKDALAGKHGEYDLVLINSPFGKKSSVTIPGETSKESMFINRDDFWATTSKQEAQLPQTRLHHPQAVRSGGGRGAGQMCYSKVAPLKPSVANCQNRPMSNPRAVAHRHLLGARR